ncbi:hypothetical protein BGZ88_001948 [Linnemannia elongata]|nr:hypothetical protein BGZ88_001948 [Linnemannia elongata]
MASFFSLPQDIVDLIIPHLTQEDYASCVLVSHAWSDLFTPSLYRTIQIVKEHRRACFKTPQGHTALAKNRHHIREFETTFLDFVFFLITGRPVITNLVSLTIHLKDHRFSSLSSDSRGEIKADVPKSTVSAVITILNNNPGLRSLSLDRGCFRHTDDEGGYVNLITAFPTARLERLELLFSDSMVTLQELRLESTVGTIAVVQQFVEGYRTLVPLYLGQEQFLALKEVAITMSGNDGGGNRGGARGDYRYTPIYLLFLLRCPNVERIRIGRMDVMTMTCLSKLLETACPKLDCLEWTYSTLNNEEPIVLLMRATTLGWKELRLPSMEAFGILALEALLETSVETLEVLRIESAERLGKNDILNLLSSARRLKRLEGASDGQVVDFTKELSVDAYAAYQEYIGGQRDRSWVLGPSMEYFQLSIEQVPRPDVVSRQGGQELTVPQSTRDQELSYEIQRWIYVQLSRMTGLKELFLGKQDFHPDIFVRYNPSWVSMHSIALQERLLEEGIHSFNYLSMEFSLESGLELLEGLKELRVLDVRRIAHNIGVKELDWMHKNWPKLESIRGLENRRRWSVDSGNEKEFKARVDVWLDAHPRGIGSSYYH